jgi:hypothetical protein
VDSPVGCLQQVACDFLCVCYVVCMLLCLCLLIGYLLFLVAVLRLFRSRGVYFGFAVNECVVLIIIIYVVFSIMYVVLVFLTYTVLCCAVSRFLVGLFVPVCLCPL